MKPGTAPLWRVFPWDPAAAEGDRFSAAFVPRSRGKGRFDLVANTAGVLYLSETPEHAIAENLQKFRNQDEPLEDDDLIAWGNRLALLPISLDPDVWSGIADLCDPDVLAEYQIHPDDSAARNRVTSQAIATRLFEKAYAGLRWWSVFFGEWHTVVLFRERVARGSLVYGRPRPLSLSDPDLLAATRLLDIG